jgi:hypothetical protein
MQFPNRNSRTYRHPPRLPGYAHRLLECSKVCIQNRRIIHPGLRPQQHQFPSLIRAHRQRHARGLKYLWNGCCVDAAKRFGFGCRNFRQWRGSRRAIFSEWQAYSIVRGDLKSGFSRTTLAIWQPLCRVRFDGMMATSNENGKARDETMAMFDSTVDVVGRRLRADTICLVPRWPLDDRDG